MKHVNEEELIEHYYGAVNQEVEDHLKECDECAHAYVALSGDLAAVKTPETPIRDAFYGEQVWRSISPSLPAYRRPGGSWLARNPWMSLGYAAACILIVLGAFLAGRMWEQQRPKTSAKHEGQSKQALILVVLGDHLDRSERLLVELKHADASNTDIISPMREEARSLLESNRSCRESVRPVDDPALAIALDHLGRLLAEIADQPAGLSESTITRLQSEMKDDGLLFEVRVLRSRVSDQQQPEVRKPVGVVQSNGSKI